MRNTSIRLFPCIAHRSPNIRRTSCSIQPTHLTIRMARATHLHSIVHIPLPITSLSSLHITTIRLYGYTDDPPFHTSCQTKTGWSLNWKFVDFLLSLGICLGMVSLFIIVLPGLPHEWHGVHGEITRWDTMGNVNRKSVT